MCIVILYQTIQILETVILISFRLSTYLKTVKPYFSFYHFPLEISPFKFLDFENRFSKLQQKVQDPAIVIVYLRSSDEGFVQNVLYIWLISTFYFPIFSTYYLPIGIGSSGCT